MVHVIDRLTEAPSVEYCVTWHKEQSRRVTVTIENLSHTDRFQNLTFNLGSRSNESGKFSNPNIVADPPAFEGRVPPPKHSGTQLEFNISDLHPGGRFELTANYSGTDTPPLRLLSATDEIYLLECSIRTFLLKNQLGFILTFSGVSLIFIAWLLYMGSSVNQE